MYNNACHLCQVVNYQHLARMAELVDALDSKLDNYLLDVWFTRINTGQNHGKHYP